MTEATDQEPIVHSVHFSVDASVIFQLGEHLISDAVQALVELIKNSYDADATEVLVEVDTRWEGIGADGSPRRGRIVVSDNGIGMTQADIRRGWLTLSNSAKREFKRTERTTDRGRTPLGEKGLGRLGAQRLGHDIEIVTVPAASGTEFKLAYSWDAFASTDAIESVELTLHERPTADPSGTWLTITGLKSPETWTEEDSRERLEEGLSQLVSPYAEVSDFNVDVSIDQQHLELTRITSSVLKAADLHYDIKYDAGTANFSGRAKLAFFQPPSGKPLTLFHDFVAADQGEALYSYLSEELKDSGLNLRRSADRGWFVEYDATATLGDIGPRLSTPSRTEPLTRTVADPGPFTGAVDSFDLGDASLRDQAVFDNKQAFRNYVKRFSGIRVYRDGFGIRVDRDWLGLSESSTSGRSYYGLRPFNTLGYIAISARRNPQLLEKTDREGFQVTPHYENFYRLLRRFVSFTEHAQTQLRRAYNTFIKQALAGSAETPPDTSPTTIADQIRASLAAAEAHRGPIQAYSEQIRAGVSDISTRLDAVERGVPHAEHKNLRAELAPIRESIRLLQHEVDRAESALNTLDAYLSNLSRLDPAGLLLTQQVADLESRLTELYEAAGLGLTAEALSHEIAQIADQLHTRVNRVERVIRSRATSADVQEFVGFVKSSVVGLRHQLSHLAPSLRYARESVEAVTMSRFLRELFEYHDERLRDRGISLEVEVAEGGDFVVEMNRGKLTQVFDNLVLNSEYWISQVARRRGEAKIVARVDQPFVYFSDTGPGVAPLFEGTLFQPFVTGRPKGQGRGLGLYIVEQLLALDGCTISLSTERNAQERRYKFELNFVEALHGD
jgi:signal transduction histidine kinase